MNSELEEEIIKELLKKEGEYVDMQYLLEKTSANSIIEINNCLKDILTYTAWITVNPDWEYKISSIGKEYHSDKIN